MNDNQKKAQQNIERAILIQDLQELASALKRTPTVKDIQTAKRKGKIRRNIEVYRKYFGSLNEALREARLPLNYNQEFTRDELIQQLRNISKKFKRHISCAEVVAVSKQHTCALPQTFTKVFGTLTNALRAAGVYKERRYTKDYLIESLKTYTKELGFVPSSSDLNSGAREGKCPSASAYQKAFGGLKNACTAAGLDVPQISYTKEQLIHYLIEVTNELGRVPKRKEIDRFSVEGKMPSANSYYRHFGNIKKAVEAAGI